VGVVGEYNLAAGCLDGVLIVTADGKAAGVLGWIDKIIVDLGVLPFNGRDGTGLEAEGAEALLLVGGEEMR